MQHLNIKPFLRFQSITLEHHRFSIRSKYVPSVSSSPSYQDPETRRRNSCFAMDLFAIFQGTKISNIIKSLSNTSFNPTAKNVLLQEFRKFSVDL